jgi:hypothetical protein
VQLLTASLEEAFKRFPIHSQDGKGDDALVVCKFFDPSGRYTFYATEGAPVGTQDWEFFGYCVSPLGEDCDEWGYVTLSELRSIRGAFGLGIERDTSVTTAERTVGSFTKRQTLSTNTRT